MKKVDVPAGSCYATAVPSTDKWITRCSTRITYHTDATTFLYLGKMKVTWNVDLFVGGLPLFFDNVWSLNKVVTFS